MRQIDQAVAEIQRCIRLIQGRLPPQLAWRLSPQDWDTVVEQSRDMERHSSSHAWLPIDRLYLLGIPVFKDPACPDMKQSDYSSFDSTKNCS